MPRWLRSILILLASLPTLYVASAAHAAPDLYAAVLPNLREEIASQTQGELSTYHLDVRFDPAASTIGGRERVTFVNAVDQPLADVAFRLYPNAFYYDEGQTTIEDVRVDSKRVTPLFEAGDTVLRVPLDDPVAPGAAVNLSFRFQTVIPADSDGTFGIFSHDTLRGTWVLADWYPIIAGYEPGSGWRLDEPTPAGDPTFSDAALYEVTLAAPEGLSLVASGSAVDIGTTSDGFSATRIVTGPAREFTLVADDDYTAVSDTIDGTLVTVYVNPDSSSEAGAGLVLAAARRALAAYSARYGHYPYEELDIVSTELDGALGVSWSGLIFLDGPDFLANPLYTESDPTRLDFTVAHEVGHQWWGATVGANSNDHTFMIEGLTNYLAAVCIADTQDEAAARRQLQIQIVQPYLTALDAYGDGVVDLPMTDLRSGPSSGALNYGKAALGFLAIRVEIGDDAFFSALADYAESFAYRNATPDDLRSVFEDASGQDLDDLWKTWFESAVTTRADVERLLEAAAA